MKRITWFKAAGALAALFLGAGLLVVDQPSLDERVAAIGPELEAALASGSVKVEPAEVVDVIYNHAMAIRVLDVRSESDYNLFHVIDARRVTMDQIKDPLWVKKLPPRTVFVIASNNEEKAVEAWKYLAAQKVPNLYILKGGVNHWLQLYSGREPDRPEALAIGDAMSYTFSAALGERHPEADPDPAQYPSLKYEPKIQNIGARSKRSGGCG